MNKKRSAIRAGTALLLVAVIVSAIFTTPLAALTPTSRMSDVYKKSKYYGNLTALELTGDQRTDVIMVAMSQLGYHEGDSESDFDGMNTSGSGNYVEYNYLYGKVDNGSGKVCYGYAWCAAFVSWCQRQAGIPTGTVKSYVSCTNWVTWFKNYSTYKTRASGYTPEPGDVIFFKDASATRASTHVGIVIYIDSGKVYTIEGNSGGIVGIHNYALTNTYIVGYGVPKYTEKTDVRVDYSRTSFPTGRYITSASSLNIRSKASTSGSILGTLPIGTYTDISEVSGNWGKISYNGKDGWISLSYAYLVFPKKVAAKTYTVKFDANGGNGAPGTLEKTEKTALTLPITLPYSSGKTFKGWSTVKGGAVKYAAGAKYDVDSDITLYAVWEDNIYKISFYDYDGKLIRTDEYKYLDKIVFPESPKRPPDGKYEYTFKGWDNQKKTVTMNDKYYAVYEKAPVKQETSKDTESATDKNTATNPITDVITDPATNPITSKVSETITGKPSEPQDTFTEPTENTVGKTDGESDGETVAETPEESRTESEAGMTDDTESATPGSETAKNEYSGGCASTINGIISVVAILSVAGIMFEKKRGIR